MKKRIIFFLALTIVLIAVGYGYRTFTVRREKLGEISFYKDADLELKIVLIHVNLPFHYVGNSYSVACQSRNTKASEINDNAELEYDLIENGWNRTPSAYLGNGIGNNKNLLLHSLADEARKLYLVKDKMTLVILASPYVSISFDGCHAFRSWSLKDNIPANLIVESTPEFEKCLEANKQYQITRDCSDVKFSGKGQPVFQDIVANDNGNAVFKVTSSAFKDSKTVSVETKDFGKTWQTITNSNRQSQSQTPGYVAEVTSSRTATVSAQEQQ
jgi:hypothetical protein